jgi:hypothetical protein
MTMKKLSELTIGELYVLAGDAAAMSRNGKKKEGIELAQRITREVTIRAMQQGNKAAVRKGNAINAKFRSHAEAL